MQNTKSVDINYVVLDSEMVHFVDGFFFPEIARFACVALDREYRRGVDIKLSLTEAHKISKMLQCLGYEITTRRAAKTAFDGGY